MINDIQKLNSHTVWKYLGKLGGKKLIYSDSIEVHGDEFDDMFLFIYAKRNEVLFLMSDQDNRLQEVVYEKPVSDKPPCYLAEGGQERVSPVWRIRKLMEQFRKSVRLAGMEVPATWCLYVTTHQFLGAYGCQKLWKEYGVTVIHSMPSLKLLSLSFNPNGHLAGCRMLKAFMSYSDPARGQQDYDSDSFQDGLRKFIDNDLATTHDSPDDGQSGQAESDSPAADLVLWGSDDDNTTTDTSPSMQAVKDGEELKACVLPPLENPEQELSKMVGCGNIRKRLEELTMMSRYNTMMQQRNPGCKLHEVSLHSIFFGRPGTGKTTMCKILGALLRQAGVLRVGHVVVCNRSTFVGNCWGDEEKAVRLAVEKAKGGVLMIDEAYLLNSASSNDPGKLVIPLLMDVLADESQRDLAVVLCGYKEQMMQLLEMNPGLQSRFPNRFEFSDFTADELLEITRRRVDEYKYQFTRSAWSKYKELIRKAYSIRDAATWGNARFVANQLEHIYLRHAARCVRNGRLTNRQMHMITSADVEPVDVPHAKRHIGF